MREHRVYKPGSGKTDPAGVAGVDVLPEGHDANVLLGQVSLDAHPVFEVPAQPVQEGHRQGIAGPETGHQFLPAGAPQGAAGGDVGKDQVFTDAVVGQPAELGLQVPGLIVGLADPGVAIGDGEQGHGNQAASAGQRPPVGSVQKTGVFEHPHHASHASFGQVFNNPVQQ